MVKPEMPLPATPPAQEQQVFQSCRVKHTEIQGERRGSSVEPRRRSRKILSDVGTTPARRKPSGEVARGGAMGSDKMTVQRSRCQGGEPRAGVEGKSDKDTKGALSRSLEKLAEERQTMSCPEKRLRS